MRAAALAHAPGADLWSPSSPPRRRAVQYGALVISLDFELLWGVRDKRTIADYGPNILGVPLCSTFSPSARSPAHGRR
jgi:hypothetical protein